jgi:UDP-N-acetylmuramate dehydrogenase
MLEIKEKEMTNLATIRTYSVSKYFAEIKNIDELIEVNLYAKKYKLLLQVIGNGTNILFSQDKYTNVLFIKLKQDFNFINFENDFVKIGAAYSSIRAGSKLVKLGYKSFLFMALIPGTIGGGIRQNAGTTKEGEIKDVFLEAELFDTLENKIVVFSKEKMEFKYRNSIIQKDKNRYIVLNAKFILKDKIANQIELLELLRYKKYKKKQKEPDGYSFGSTFKKLDKPVWQYLKSLKLCGKKIGGATFSEKHCNWIINFNNASGEDIVNLINYAKTKAYNVKNIKLHEEVEII